MKRLARFSWLFLTTIRWLLTSCNFACHNKEGINNPLWVFAFQVLWSTALSGFVKGLAVWKDFQLIFDINFPKVLWSASDPWPIWAECKLQHEIKCVKQINMHTAHKGTPPPSPVNTAKYKGATGILAVQAATKKLCIPVPCPMFLRSTSTSLHSRCVG